MVIFTPRYSTARGKPPLSVEQEPGSATGPASTLSRGKGLWSYQESNDDSSVVQPEAYQNNGGGCGSGNDHDYYDYDDDDDVDLSR